MKPPGIIVGNGDIASAIKPREGFLFFASGVSNSQETDEREYNREIEILKQQPKDRRVVYFSSLSIFYKNERYQQHKITMEGIVKTIFQDWCIVRLGNITWGNNPNTIINYFKYQIKKREIPIIENTQRFLIDKEQFQYWMAHLPDWNCEMNIPGKMMTVKEIVQEIKKENL